ncbi:MAG: metal ABC transporter permease [Actinobacteria bacterium]|nr:metal ABC transporter permease [Actinomycetota bacterium]
MIGLFTEEFALRALVAALAVGAAAPVVGGFLVQRRLSLIGDGIGHLAFAGVALGILAGVAPVWGALAVALLGAAALERLRARGRLAGDLSLALVFYAGIALGAVVLSALDRFDGSVLGVLFGSLYATSWSETWLMVALCAVVVALALLFYRELFVVALDEETARASGLPVDSLNLLLVALTALLVTAGMRAVGLLLVASLLVVPVAAGSRLAHSFRGTLGWGVVMGVLSTVGGLVAALLVGTLTPGATIVLASILLFVGATVGGRRAARRHRPVVRS